MDLRDIVALLIFGVGCAFLLHLRQRRARIVRRWTAPIDRSTHEESDPELLTLIEQQEARTDPQLATSAGPYRAPGPRTPRQKGMPSAGPIVDAVSRRCTRCDMRTRADREYCDNCARQLAS